MTHVTLREKTFHNEGVAMQNHSVTPC
ncbi:hypothetical protein FRAAL4696 [Frankia alni ACN14a]|uniref:Uncharacterized protein n=1 Tax=Frankia alni (strain DSM 45986 / CECT 9034 / ACN14a) TaxID=326424 RepID=Q0RGP8_FRAAA|nr:hypothetical protein FRAAL4696 [Frankia alni ACN14a]